MISLKDLLAEIEMKVMTMMEGFGEEEEEEEGGGPPPPGPPGPGLPVNPPAGTPTPPPGAPAATPSPPAPPTPPGGVQAGAAAAAPAAPSLGAGSSASWSSPPPLISPSDASEEEAVVEETSGEEGGEKSDGTWQSESETEALEKSMEAEQAGEAEALLSAETPGREEVEAGVRETPRRQLEQLLREREIEEQKRAPSGGDDDRPAARGGAAGGAVPKRPPPAEQASRRVRTGTSTSQAAGSAPVERATRGRAAMTDGRPRFQTTFSPGRVVDAPAARPPSSRRLEAGRGEPSKTSPGKGGEESAAAPGGARAGLREVCEQVGDLLKEMRRIQREQGTEELGRPIRNVRPSSRYPQEEYDTRMGGPGGRKPKRK